MDAVRDDPPVPRKTSSTSEGARNQVLSGGLLSRGFLRIPRELRKAPSQASTPNSTTTPPGPSSRVRDALNSRCQPKSVRLQPESMFGLINPEWCSKSARNPCSASPRNGSIPAIPCPAGRARNRGVMHDSSKIASNSLDRPGSVRTPSPLGSGRDAIPKRDGCGVGLYPVEVPLDGQPLGGSMRKGFGRSPCR